MVWSLKKLLKADDEVIFLFDACTDGSLEIFNKIKHHLPCTVNILTSEKDLFETKANNDILQTATKDIVVLFQDDMICRDSLFRNKILNVIKIYGKELGLMGGRDGFDLASTKFPEDIVERVSSWTPYPSFKDTPYKTRLLKDGEFKQRTFVNRGPLVFTRRLLETVGYFDEAYFPLWNDDTDYCARARFRYGLKNVVFQCKIQSPLKWGATRGGTKLKMKPIMKKNWKLFIDRWGGQL